MGTGLTLELCYLAPFISLIYKKDFLKKFLHEQKEICFCLQT